MRTEILKRTWCIIPILALMLMASDSSAGRWAERSRQNRAECNAWCDAHAECVRCDTRRGCGPGLANLRSWTGPGRNWHACRERGADSPSSKIRSGSTFAPPIIARQARGSRRGEISRRTSITPATSVPSDTANAITPPGASTPVLNQPCSVT